MIYFDSAATAFLRPAAVGRAVSRSLRSHAGYGRSGHIAAAQAAREVYACRETAAALFDVSLPEQVVFCYNATHALNTAIFGLALPGKTAVISGYEHNAVTRPLQARQARGQGNVVVAESPPFDSQKALEAFDALLDASCGLCVCTMVSNVYGNILPVAEIGALCAKRGIPFVVDASQAAGSLPVSLRAFHADAVCMPGHKGLMGPPGTGLLLLGDRLPSPLLFGGTGTDSVSPLQPPAPPERYESGTLNIAGICGLGAGLRYVAAHREAIRNHEQILRAAMCQTLSALPGVRVYDGSEPGGGLLSFTVEHTDCEALGDALARKGVAVRAGLHCAPLAHRSGGTADTGTVRVSFCGRNTLGEVRRFGFLLREILHG